MRVFNFMQHKDCCNNKHCQNIFYTWLFVPRKSSVSGTATFSETRKLFFGKKDIITLAPNPVSDWLMISIEPGDATKLVQVFSSNGTLIYKNSDEVLGVNIKNYPAGIYVVKIITKNSYKYEERVIKN